MKQYSWCTFVTFIPSTLFIRTNNFPLMRLHTRPLVGYIQLVRYTNCFLSDAPRRIRYDIRYTDCLCDRSDHAQWDVVGSVIYMIPTFAFQAEIYYF